MKDKLYNIIKELSFYKRNKNDLLAQYINERLNKSLQTYYKELIDSFDYLKYKDSSNILKKLNRK